MHTGPNVDSPAGREFHYSSFLFLPLFQAESCMVKRASNAAGIPVWTQTLYIAIYMVYKYICATAHLRTSAFGALPLLPR